ncbi:hypothetical protein O3G_MSEX011969 [Manduca sexta]|uniref:Peptidase S1 domain-containing protein n=1 Tax=Manduca sexta TaxID=7130 RepID=A0A921ZLZ2_MANSE|nr:hypothetical protein O3G_MSEX011969 [Manduca sexta]KAG6460408.1 hypothetical protein O3G_MSEX011969 [Manduca sexta]
MTIKYLLLVMYFVFGAYAGRTYGPKISKGYRIHMSMAPWHAGLYTKTSTPYKQICGGTVIAKNVVVTAAHCVTVDRVVLPASQFAVGAGKVYRPWNDTHDVGAQKSDVKDIKVPPRYQGVVTNFQHDIALLILTTEFTYNEHVKPACLNFDAVHDAEQLREGQSGKVMGWDLTGENSAASQVLQGATLPNVAIDKCIDQSPVSFRSFITGDKICAGYNNGTAVCRGDSGGGLIFTAIMNSQLATILRGIVSTSPATENLCNIYTWATFTHLLPHEHFVKAFVPNVEEGCGTPANGVIGTRSSLVLGRNYNCPCTCPGQ